jgi:hypothetical protein
VRTEGTSVVGMGFCLLRNIFLAIISIHKRSTSLQNENFKYEGCTETIEQRCNASKPLATEERVLCDR